MRDVAVIGAGPAGLLAARRCAEAGLDVEVLEEHPLVGQPTHCTGVISLETATLAKIPDDIILKRLSRARLIGPRGARCELHWHGQGSEEILVIDRGAFDRELAEQAVAAGALIETGCRVEALAITAHGVTLGVGTGIVRARAVILACGVSYRFQRQLGLGLPGRVAHTAQIEVDADQTDSVELYLGRDVAPEGFLWVVPISRGDRHGFRIGVLARGDAGACLERFLRRPEVRARLATHPQRPVRRLLPLQPLPKTFADRLLVVGDAGGFTKPTTGGGIFYSLVSASLAAETLLEAFDGGGLDEAFLARYERRWQAELGQEFRVAGWLRQFLGRCPDADIERMVRASAAEPVQAVIRRTARFNRHRDVILALLREPGIASLLLRNLFR
ncbi:MAG TPA: NAD(P)/FAD-dependent oxidoreductase [Methylomirabilota bacterium]|nr:NAD(P)/FAD-dependent oxidoreductase [Methylomirabilota bacterium]